MGRKPTEIVQIKLRLREELRRKLLREAEKKDHSLNIEIAQRLEQSFDNAEHVREIDEILKRVQDGFRQALKEEGKL
jgi:hypothetical protein